MGAIKDIVDLTTQLSSSVQDRKLAAEILQIQMSILVVQREDAELVTEEITALQNKILAIEGKFSAINLRDRYDFVKELGIYKSKDTGHYFCTSCLMKNASHNVWNSRTYVDRVAVMLNACGLYSGYPSRCISHSNSLFFLVASFVEPLQK